MPASNTKIPEIYFYCIDCKKTHILDTGSPTFCFPFIVYNLSMRKKCYRAIVILTLIFCCVPRHGKALSGDITVHDPSTLIKQGNRYWTFSTGNGIIATYSTDLFSWKRSKQIFEKGSWPVWINKYVPAFTGYFWAPDIIFMNNKYYLYYACSSVGDYVSVIGVATSPTLDPNSADYKWTDLGMVVSSSSPNDVNAIDPSIIKDDNGKVYLCYGSFFNGIGIIELNPSTGKVKARARLNRVAGGNASSFEGSCLIKEGNYYYLFVNRARCCSGSASTYYVVVGRSRSPAGPFIDKNGLNLRGSGNDAGGTTVMVSSGRYIGPGHFGLLRENGRYIVSTHYYDGYVYGTSKLDIADLQFAEDGWPVINRDLIPSGRYKITNKSSNMVFDAGDCTGQAGIKVLQSKDDNYQPCQLWDLTAVGDGYYKISNEPGNKTIDVPNCNSSNGIKLQTWTWLNNSCQKFKIEQLANGAYIFTSLANTILTKVVEVPSAAAGTPLEISDFTGAATQQWDLKQVRPPLVAEADSITDSGFTTRWKTTPYAAGYKLDVSTTFADAAYQTIAAWNFEAGNNTANEGIAENLNKPITSAGTDAPAYNVAGNGGQTAMAAGWTSGAAEKFWEISFTTENFYNLKVSSRQRSSDGGPLHYKIQYKIGDSGTYTEIRGALITNMNNYRSGAVNNIDLPQQCNNQRLVYLRWLLAASVNSADLEIPNSAESNIDDIVVKGNPGNFLKSYSNLAVNDTSKIVSGILPGTDYYYRVRAMQGSFASLNSDIIKVTTKGASPVDFIQLKADQQSNGIQVNWNVYQRKNVSRYEVEKSQNGWWYAKIGSMDAKAVSDEDENYNFLDETANQDESFYRIKAVIDSGDTKYSSVAKVTIDKGPIGVVFYPNPVYSNNVFIRFSDRAKGLNNIILLNSIGQQVFKKQILHPGGLSIQTLVFGDDIASGIYQLIVINGSKKNAQTIIIN